MVTTNKKKLRQQASCVDEDTSDVVSFTLYILMFSNVLTRTWN